MVAVSTVEWHCSFHCSNCSHIITVTSLPDKRNSIQLATNRMLSITHLYLMYSPRKWTSTSMYLLTFCVHVMLQIRPIVHN